MTEDVRPDGVSLVLRSLRASAWLMAILIALGAVAGVFAALSTPYASSLLFRVVVSDADSQRVKQVAQTSINIIASESVYQRAALRLGVDPRQLQRNTEVAWVTDTELVSVTAYDRDSARATAIAAAVGDAVAVDVTESSTRQFREATASTAQALGQGTLRDPVAERARLAAIGAGTATRQNEALGSGSTLQQMGLAQRPEKAGLTIVTGPLLGAVVGLLLGVAVVALRSRRRDRTVRLDDLDPYSPRVRPVLRQGAAKRIHMAWMQGVPGPLLVVSTGSLREQRDELADELRQLSMSGLNTSADKATPRPTARQRVPDRRAGDEEQPSWTEEIAPARHRTTNGIAAPVLVSDVEKMLDVAGVGMPSVTVVVQRAARIDLRAMEAVTSTVGSEVVFVVGC